MGFTRSKRYANHTSGKKYYINPQSAETLEEEKLLKKDPNNLIPYEIDENKLISSSYFYDKLQLALNNQKYKDLKRYFIEYLSN